MSKRVEIGFAEVRNGNHLAFKRLFDSTYKELVVYAHGYLYEKSASEDVVQEVFIRLWERSRSLDVQTDIRAYLFAMVRNACLNHLKKYKISDRAKVLEDPGALMAYYEPEQFGEEQKQPLYGQVLQVMDKLPRKMRAIVELRFLGHYRYQEIADELDVSVNTVKTQLQRAKTKFAELMLTLVLLFWT
ncbi:RNA polymerase sigma factor [Pseudozobellia thermophila]|uniref:RNA polymerase sigma-70 factor, ECF subfamily n=1 Tax=Pseudozobellia thermophila TaxID=192903 RepID=A0A1M6KUW1_9FLAO|nr:RNA polymerase sigma-70 factor [Pseudozobellia thermophila]SHJ62741.1 RNA polymerase sigma-70 factor, ECF subfamily [Pseudozobellia thermophila]